jgi:DNA-binding NarL/FixJ family response regulator
MTDTSVTAFDDGPFTVRFLLGTQLAGYGRFAEADDAFDAAGAAAVRDDHVALAAAVRASNRFWRLGDSAGAHRVLDDAGRAIVDGPALEGIRAERALLLLFGGRTAHALALSRGVRRRGRTSTAAAQLAFGIEALARGVRGEVAELPSFPAAPPADDTFTPLVADDGLAGFQHGVLAVALCLARSVNGLDPFVDDRSPPCPSAREAMAGACEGARDTVDGSNLLWAGRPRAALVVLQRAADRLRVSDRLYTQPIALGELAYCHALLGDVDGAARAAEDAERRRHPVSRLENFFVGRGQAWAAGVRGELTDACDRLVMTATECERLGQPVLAARAWYDLARFGDAERAAAPLRRLAEGGDPQAATDLLAAHVAALAGGDAPGVGAAAMRARRRGHHLHAAEAAAQAALLHGRRRRAEADRWVATAQTFAEACEGACSPVLARLSHLDLTWREREVIGLVARGLSNPEIARRLHLSVRTVENYLQAVYGKLGVHRREELGHLRPFGMAGEGPDPAPRRPPSPSAAPDRDGAHAAVDADGDDRR